MIISIASGKGGTGKTIISTSLALSLDNNVQFLDCDVEEPNAHIFLKPELAESHPVYIPVPEVDESKCNYCGKCQEICAYNAIAVVNKKVLVFPELCHGCGGCTLLCPEKAIREINKPVGVVEKGRVPGAGSGIEFIHGKLNVGEVMAPPVIRAVKECIVKEKIVIIDAPPGTSCPVIEAVKGSDFSILVTEPTPFGLNDLVLAVEVLRILRIPFGVIINRSDMGDGEVSKYCKKEDIPVLMSLPFSRKIAESYSRGISIVESQPEYKAEFRKLFNEISVRVADIKRIKK